MKYQGHLDYETASDVDLKACGLGRYAEDESTRVLMAAYAIGDAPPEIWLPHLEPMPDKLCRMLEDPECELVAHNAAFERAITKHVLGIDVPLERWTCTQAMSHSLALPGDLDRLTTVLKLKHRKNKRGKALIKLFCEPNRRTKKNPQEWNDWNTHPDEWSEFVGYCLDDVRAERHAHLVLSRYLPSYRGESTDLWVLAQKINERGVPVDLGFIEAANSIADKEKEILRRRMTEISGIANVNAPGQVLEWLVARGYPFNNLRKPRVKMALEFHADKMTKAAIDLATMRLQAARTSTTKLVAMMRAACSDGRLRHMFEFRAASRTGRFGGRVVQLQNLARPDKAIEKFLEFARSVLATGDHASTAVYFDNPLDAVTSSIRSAITAPPGYILRVADFAAIELAVLAWWAKSKFWLDVLRQGLDPYKSFGVHFLNKSYDEITKGERFICKPGALGSGYRLGPGFLYEDKNGDVVKSGLWGYAENMGVKLTQEECQRSTTVYRELSPEIVDLWYELDRVVLDVIRDQKPRKITGGLIVDIRAPFLRIRLPSGRRLHYCHPRVETRKVKSGMDADGNPTYFNATNMTYMGMDQQTKQWVRMTTHGGKLVENVTQAIALDLLNAGMVNAEEDGFTTILHVHDEIGTLERINDSKHSLDALIRSITRLPDWAEGLPLNAAGYEAPFYRKD